MKLSVIILTCDKDFKYLNRCVKSVIDNVKVTDYEIIIVDSRNDKNDILDLPENDKIKVVSNNGNKYTFESRRLGFKNSTGDYIYFVDSDDEVINEITEDMFTAKLVNFLFEDSTELNKESFMSNKPIEALWCHFISRDVLELIYSFIKEEISICTAEDSWLLNFIRVATENERTLPKRIYKYNRYLGGYHPVGLEIEQKEEEKLIFYFLRFKKYIAINGTI